MKAVHSLPCAFSELLSELGNATCNHTGDVVGVGWWRIQLLKGSFSLALPSNCLFAICGIRTQPSFAKLLGLFETLNIQNSFFPLQGQVLNKLLEAISES